MRGQADTDAYSFATKKNYRDLVDYSRLDGELARVHGAGAARRRGLGCRDAGRADLRLTRPAHRISGGESAGGTPSHRLRSADHLPVVRDRLRATDRPDHAVRPRENERMNKNKRMVILHNPGPPGRPRRRQESDRPGERRSRRLPKNCATNRRWSPSIRTSPAPSSGSGRRTPAACSTWWSRSTMTAGCCIGDRPCSTIWASPTPAAPPRRCSSAPTKSWPSRCCTTTVFRPLPWVTTDVCAALPGKHTFTEVMPITRRAGSPTTPSCEEDIGNRQNPQRTPGSNRAGLLAGVLHRRSGIQRRQAGRSGAAGPEIRFIDYPKGKYKVVDYQAKWDEESFEYLHTERSSISPRRNPLLRQLSEIADRCWRAFGRGYARVDFRVDPDGQPWVLKSTQIHASPRTAVLPPPPPGSA